MPYGEHLQHTLSSMLATILLQKPHASSPIRKYGNPPTNKDVNIIFELMRFPQIRNRSPLLKVRIKELEASQGGHPKNQGHHQSHLTNQSESRAKHL